MIAPMLAKPVERLPVAPGYLYEIKLDGQRTLAEVTKKELQLYTRTFQIVTARYPELKELCSCLCAKRAVLDGEIVALEDGVPSFELLQQRMNLRDVRMAQAILNKIPVIYYVFDILNLNGKPLLRVPLIERKEMLSRAVQPGRSIKILPYFDSQKHIVERAGEFGYEGVVAKKSNSRYLPGERTGLWLKYKFQLTDSFVIGGWLEGGRVLDFGSLLVGKYGDRQLVYCGRVGTGFNEAQIRMLMGVFSKAEVAECPFSQRPYVPGKIHWMRPTLAAEVKFKEWTKAGILRSPVYLGLRPDLRPRDCRF